jgi:hypothetical protein
MGVTRFPISTVYARARAHALYGHKGSVCHIRHQMPEPADILTLSDVRPYAPHRGAK